MQIKDLPYQQRRVIERARQILEQCESDEAQRYAEQHEIKPSLHNIVYLGAYLDGARAMLNRLLDETNHRLNVTCLKDKDAHVYNAAIIELISRDKHHLNLYLEHRYEIRFRNHQRDKKGRLLSAEAYFVTTERHIVEAD